MPWRVAVAALGKIRRDLFGKIGRKQVHRDRAQVRLGIGGLLAKPRHAPTGVVERHLAVAGGRHGRRNLAHDELSAAASGEPLEQPRQIELEEVVAREDEPGVDRLGRAEVEL